MGVADHVALYVSHDPVTFTLLALEFPGFDRIPRASLHFRRFIIVEQRWIVRHKNAGGLEHFARAPMILLKMESLFLCQVEMIDECREDFPVCSSPRVNRLLVVADSENILVLAREFAHNPILRGVQILKL